ncbi:hypothetical protein LPJ59_001274, partial [Coemansia sp. RSA 2399]
MSRHRAIRNLDLEEEFYDEGNGDGYDDEIGDLSEEDQLRLLSGIESVKTALGPNTRISDKEIKESLWYYYFDEAATVAWLRKTHKLKPKSGEDASSDEARLTNAHHRPGSLRDSKDNPPRPDMARPLIDVGTGPAGPASLRSLAVSGKGGLSLLSRKMPSLGSLQGPTSVVGKALAALKAKPVTSSPTDSHSTPGLPMRQGLSLSQLAVRSSTAPVLKNFSGRQVPAPKGILLDSTLSNPSQQPSRWAGLDVSSHQQLPVATLYAPPSSLARFILDGIAVSTPSDPEETRTASISVAQRLASEIARVIDANKPTRIAGAVSVNVDRKPHERPCHSANFIAQDVSFLNVLTTASGAQRFAFDTPSPDDRVLASQRMAGSETAEPPSTAGSPSAAAGGGGALSKAPKPPTKEVGKLKIGIEKSQPQVSESDSSRPATPAAKTKKRINVVEEYSKSHKTRETLNLVVVGHVDAGKSTLMGHLLYALGQVNERTIRKFERDAEKIGKGSFAYAWVLDETEEERSRGVTMDVATNSFTTEHRKFTLLDAPGHRDFVPNMISGASRADVAILVVDASTGEFEAGFDGNGQTREHAILIRSLGVRQLVVAINKLDMVDWSESRFDEITSRLLEFLTGCGYLKTDVRFVPVGGLKGINL